jgi:hypothetical protein
VSALALAGLALLAPALWNEFPLLQYDTGGYLARWYEGYLVPSRPGAYGLVLAAAALLHFWPVVLAQAALTVWVLALVLRSLGFGGRPFVLLAIVSLLSVITTLLGSRRSCSPIFLPGFPCSRFTFLCSTPKRRPGGSAGG